MKRLVCAKVCSSLWGRQGWVICTHCPLGFPSHSAGHCWSVQSRCSEASVSKIPETWVFREGRIHGQLSIWIWPWNRGCISTPICVCFEKVREREKITQVFLFNCFCTWAGEVSEASVHEDWCAVTTDPDVEWGLRACGTHSSSESFCVFLSNS